MSFRESTSAVVILAFVVSAVAVCTAQATRQISGPGPHTTPQHQSAAAKEGPKDQGERVFKQNCSRCHNAPEGFPPGISGTIARHMRVRANLNRDDEQALIKFLNP